MVSPAATVRWMGALRKRLSVGTVGTVRLAMVGPIRGGHGRGVYRSAAEATEVLRSRTPSPNTRSDHRTVGKAVAMIPLHGSEPAGSSTDLGERRPTVVVTRAPPGRRELVGGL